jgi:hypothetical protein
MDRSESKRAEQSFALRKNGAEQPKSKKKKRSMKKRKRKEEKKNKTPMVEAVLGLPLVGTETCAKTNQKGVLAAGRSAPASRLILG